MLLRITARPPRKGGRVLSGTVRRFIIAGKRGGMRVWGDCFYYGFLPPVRFSGRAVIAGKLIIAEFRETLILTSAVGWLRWAGWETEGLGGRSTPHAIAPEVRSA